MFFNQCQTTNSLELYNPNSKELLSNWEFKGKISKTFDKELKCYTHTLDIGRLSKMSFPKSKSSLNIVQTYIVFQLYLYTTKNFFIEIDFTDTNNIKSRFLFSTNLKILTVNFFTSVIPIIQLPIGNWINLSIDILSFINSNFKNKKTFKKIDFISVSGSLKIRRIFTMRGKINENLLENSIEKINKNDKSYINDQYGNSEVIPAKFLINNNNVKVYNVNMNAENVFNNNNNLNNNILNNNILNNNNLNNNNIEYFNINESKISYRNYSKEKENKNENDNVNDNKNNDNKNNDNKIIFTTNNNNNLIDSSKKNKRYKLENRITNTNEPIQISTNTNASNIDGISNSVSSSIVNNFNKFNNNININTIESKQQINEMIQSKENENEFEFDDKGLIYISKNENKNIENDIKNLTQDMNMKNNNNLNNNLNNDNNNINDNNNFENSLKISQIKNNILKNNSIEKIAIKQSTNSRPYSPPLSNSLTKKNTNN
jgi:hypothetical protein